MTIILRFVAILAFSGVLSACGHADLKAPCDARDATLTTGSLSHAALDPPADRCGPMRSINAPAADTLNLHRTRGGRPLP